MASQSNKISTPSYLIKRLKQSNYVVIRLFQGYSKSDARTWSIMVDPGGLSLMITCYRNYPELDDVSFEFNDGGNLWPKNFMVKTKSVEVILMQLLEKQVPIASEKSSFFKPLVENA